MVTFPNAKINIGLSITGKRSDGFHNIESIFYPVNICDILEIVSHDSTQLSVTGIEVGDTNDNLCIKAYEILKADFPEIGNINMHLHKNIPAGAGLGGGSADAAFCIKLLNSKFALGLKEEQMITYAARLGSDCAFFIRNVPAFAIGRGEILQDITLDLSSYKIVVVHPGLHVSTREAFSSLSGYTAASQLKERILKPIETWKSTIKNDFETPIFSMYPEIGALKEQLYISGAIYASMSGSGSAVYGIFNKNEEPELKFPAHYFFRWV